jgi:hypothetical protein
MEHDSGSKIDNHESKTRGVLNIWVMMQNKEIVDILRYLFDKDSTKGF